MKTNQLFLTVFFTLFSFITNAQTNYGGEIVSYQKFGQGLMVTKAKIVPLSGTVSNIFFFNREDEPWNDNVWYEYDWEIRGKYPKNGWAQIRVREEEGGQLKDKPENISTTDNLGETFYNYILIRKGNDYIYDIRKDFDINSYDYTKSSAHGNNSKSLIVGGPRIYTTGGSVANIPQNKQLDFSLGITAFDNGWAGRLPSGSYSGDMVVDYTRFYALSNNGQINTNTQWSDEFNSNQLNYGKWQVANWTSGKTQFTQSNIRFEDGNIVFRINRDDSSGGVSNQNIALNGTASQSSTSHGGSASRAIDNNTNGKWSNRSVTHTNNQTNAWWQVELAQDSELDRIEIYNRTDCCATRLSDFSVSVLNDDGAVVWTQFYANHPSSSLVINLDATGKTVRVNLEGTLSLAEVKVFGTGLGTTTTSNLALSGSASQSSTGHGGSASRAIDNNTNGKWSNGSVTHTNNQNNAWWQVQLAQNSNIERIEIYNRTDNCCVSRLSDFTVYVLNENGSVAWSQFYSNTPSPSMSINLNTTGKTVKVELDGTLSLAEVKVFGSYTGNGARLDETNLLDKSKVFPNPTTGKLFIDLSDYLEKEIDIMVSDPAGKQHLLNSFDRNHPSTIELSLEGLNDGFYILYIKPEHYRAIVKKIYLNRSF